MVLSKSFVGRAALAGMTGLGVLALVGVAWLPAPPRFADDPWADEQEPEHVDLGDHSYARLLGGREVHPRFEPSVERARVLVSRARLSPGVVVIGYPRGGFGSDCGLMLLDSVGPLYDRIESPGLH